MFGNNKVAKFLRKLFAFTQHICLNTFAVTNWFLGDTNYPCIVCASFHSIFIPFVISFNYAQLNVWTDLFFATFFHLSITQVVTKTWSKFHAVRNIFTKEKHRLVFLLRLQYKILPPLQLVLFMSWSMKIRANMQDNFPEEKKKEKSKTAGADRWSLNGQRASLWVRRQQGGEASKAQCSIVWTLTQQSYSHTHCSLAFLLQQPSWLHVCKCMRIPTVQPQCVDTLLN